MTRFSNRACAVALATVIVLQAAGIGVVAAQETPTDSPSAAAEIYVEDDGDAVLVYESDPPESAPNRTEFGISTDENLAYLLLTDPVDGEPDVTGELEVAATRTSLWGDGQLSMPRPEALRSFALDASGRTTRETAQSDLSLSATIADASGTSLLIESGSTNGTVTITPDRLAATGSLNVDTAIPVPANARESLSIDLQESADGYVLAVERSRAGRPATTPQNRSAATAALEARYDTLASELGGSATVSVEEYSETREGSTVRIEQAYTVRFSGIDNGIGERVGRSLAATPRVSDEQAEQVASALRAVEVERIRVDYALTDDGVSGSVDVDVGNYGQLATAYFDVASSIAADSDGSDQVERMRTQFEAQGAADLEQRFTWSGSLDHPDDETVRAEFTARSRSTNWADYVDELEARDVPFVEQRYGLSGSADGDRLSFTAHTSMSGERLFAELLRGVPTADERSPEAAAMVDAIRNARPETARLVASYDADGFRLEAGAAFGNLSALGTGLREVADVPPATEVVGRLTDGSGTTTVRLSSAVGSQPTEADVRALSTVDAETTVHMPGEWDRTFETMDAERASSFLAAVDERTTGDGPGFGSIGAIVALVAGIAVVARRR